jgi:hypothetical protein
MVMRLACRGPIKPNGKHILATEVGITAAISNQSRRNYVTLYPQAIVVEIGDEGLSCVDGVAQTNLSSLSWC